MLPFTSNPFPSEKGIDTTIHDIYKACFEAIQSDTQAHIAMYMWHRQGKPKVINDPKVLTDSFISSVNDTGVCASRKLISHTIMPPTVHNGDVDHRPLVVYYLPKDW